MASEKEDWHEELGGFGYGNLENYLLRTAMMSIVSQLSPRVFMR